MKQQRQLVLPTIIFTCLTLITGCSTLLCSGPPALDQPENVYDRMKYSLDCDEPEVLLDCFAEHLRDDIHSVIEKSGFSYSTFKTAFSMGLLNVYLNKFSGLKLERMYQISPELALLRIYQEDERGIIELLLIVKKENQWRIDSYSLKMEGSDDSADYKSIWGTRTTRPPWRIQSRLRFHAAGPQSYHHRSREYSGKFDEEGYLYEQWSEEGIDKRCREKIDRYQKQHHEINSPTT